MAVKSKMAVPAEPDVDNHNLNNKNNASTAAADAGIEKPSAGDNGDVVHVFVSGCYDVLHAGHLQFFSEAR